MLGQSEIQRKGKLGLKGASQNLLQALKLGLKKRKPLAVT